MNWNVIFTVFGVGVAFLFLSPFYIAIALAYAKSKTKMYLELYKEFQGANPINGLDDALEQIFKGGNK